MNNKDKSLRLYPICILAVALIAVLVAVGVNRLFDGNDPVDNAAAEGGQAAVSARQKSDIPAAAEENDLLQIAVKAEGTEEKVCYLTFDDGPTAEVTPKVLDVLNEKGVKATFFLVGKMIDKNRDLAKREYDEGHLLANHSYSHEYGSLYASAESFWAEIQQTEGRIREVTGEEPFRLIRFPGGSYNAGAYAAEKQQYKELLKQNGYYFADWNCLNGDAERSGVRSAAELLNRVKQTSGAKNIVVLMHDAATKATTAEALPDVIDYLRSEGYVFRRLDEIKYYGGSNAKTAPDMTL